MHLFDAVIIIIDAETTIAIAIAVDVCHRDNALFGVSKYSRAFVLEPVLDEIYYSLD